MTLHVEQNKWLAYVAQDLAHIVGNDYPNLGQDPNDATLVTYAESISTFATDRINALVNSFPDNPITIWGVDPTFVTPAGQNITDRSGVTIWDQNQFNATDTGLSPGADITIYYDVTGDDGKGYCVLDTAHKGVLFTTDTILFHELAHAYHLCNNDYDLANQEFQASSDENSYRNQIGMNTRDPTSQVGGIVGRGVCSTMEPPKGPGSIQKPRTSCFIVSAAYGSDRAAEVERFRQLRDRLLRQSVIIDGFMTEMLRDYYRFSPRIAADMAASSTLRRYIRLGIVEPLLDYLGLFELYVRGAWTRPEWYRHQVAIALEASSARLTDAGESAAAASSIRFALLQSLPVRGDDGVHDPRSWPLPAVTDVPCAISYLGLAVVTSGTPTWRLRWALLRPLVIYWTAAELWASGSARKDPAIDGFIGDVITWLLDFPARAEMRKLTPDALGRDLRIMRDFVYTDPRVRRRFATRLCKQDGGQPEKDWPTAFAAAGYLGDANR